MATITYILFILCFHGVWWLGNPSGIHICKGLAQCKLTKEGANGIKCKELDMFFTHLYLLEASFPCCGEVDELTQWCLD